MKNTKKPQNINKFYIVEMKFRGYNIRTMITKKIAKEELLDFYQSKFDYYKVVSAYCAVIIAFSEISYFFTDCQLYGRFSWETLIPRLSVLLPLALFLLLYRKVKSYKAGVLLYYLIPHAAMWATIWSVYHLENRDFVREGFIIMHFAFLTIGLAMPVMYHTIIHGFIFFNILVSNLFNHYEHLDMMLTLAIPIYIGVILLQIILENTYADHYLIKKSLELNSITDELTGVYNRFKINEIVDPETHKFYTDESIYIAMLDIDYFKKVNDNYGHEAGDIILKYVGSRLETHVQNQDYVIRWGGEEFVLLLVDCDANRVAKVTEEIRQDISSGENSVCPLTISIGYSKYKAEENYHSCLDRADKALYYAKKHGRNQVVDYTNI
ncbi:GGDEF domain-containing protein [Pseudobutyrivibrio sp.]|uniref:GGDEF domain-containing protein n=1 Tax=Pseudobutyrivibrio sp. TaxID=2014367 RepID=UPI0025E7477E|nr:GGDEF domain-containing protein [Pseudobutyrivibrio sp.]